MFSPINIEAVLSVRRRQQGTDAKETVAIACLIFNQRYIGLTGIVWCLILIPKVTMLGDTVSMT